MFFRVYNIQKRKLFFNENEPKKKPVQIQDNFRQSKNDKIMDRQDKV